MQFTCSSYSIEKWWYDVPKIFSLLILYMTLFVFNNYLECCLMRMQKFT